MRVFYPGIIGRQTVLHLPDLLLLLWDQAIVLRADGIFQPGHGQGNANQENCHRFAGKDGFVFL